MRPSAYHHVVFYVVQFENHYSRIWPKNTTNSVPPIPIPRWNFRKANWAEFVKELDHIVQWIPFRVNSYNRSMGAVKLVVKKQIPRGFRKNLIPRWNEICSAEDLNTINKW